MWVLVVVGLAVFGMGFHQAYAALGDEGSSTSINPFLKRGYGWIGLSDIQMAAVKAVVKKQLPGLKIMTRQIVAERRVLKSLIRAESVDETAIRAQVAKLAALEADRCVKRAFTGREIRAILTPEQLKKASDMRLFRERMTDRRIDGVFAWFED
jgi:Spy/CpxP family protein refolding chaperone